MNENKWNLQSNGKGLYILTLDGPEGTDKIWVSEDELASLKIYLNTLELPIPQDELPL